MQDTNVIKICIWLMTLTSMTFDESLLRSSHNRRQCCQWRNIKYIDKMYGTHLIEAVWRGIGEVFLTHRRWWVVLIIRHIKSLSSLIDICVANTHRIKAQATAACTALEFSSENTLCIALKSRIIGILDES